METNALYYGDNLGILRDFIPSESIDLVYLDPPFNSNRDYNLIFKDESGAKSDAQILAFEDTWHWGPDAGRMYEYLTNSARHQGRVPDAVSQIVSALRSGIGASEMLAYLVEMAVRLVELRRVLKPTGSLYLHCDPTASSYLRLILDAVFEPTNFRNEIIWQRTNAHNDARRFGRVHDVILYYARSEAATWNRAVVPYDPKYIESYFRYKDPDGRRWRSGDATAPGGRGPLYEWHGHTRNWRFTFENMERLEAAGKLYYTPKGIVRVKQYLDEAPGMVAQDIWSDEATRYIVSWSGEGLNYPTQKPLGLLERIIAASSNPGDVVLDPFCGCGTALVAAQKLGRCWIGIDITYLAIAVLKARLKDIFGIEAHINGAPTEVAGAKALAEQGLEGRYQFEHWAFTLVDAHPAGGGLTKKKGADSGIDGKITFTDIGGSVQSVIVSVKSGGVNRGMVSDLVGVMHREAAAMALFVTLEDPSGPMKAEAAQAGDFYSELSKKSYPRVQIITIRDLLDGRKPEVPLLVLPAYQQAEKLDAESPGQEKLFG